MIADTSFIIDLMRGDETALEKLSEIVDRGLGHYIASPTVMELAVGVSVAKLPKKEREKVEEIIEGFQILPLDSTSAWRSGVELAKLRKVGMPLDPIDAQIADIALQNDDVIVTRNLKHFERFRGLKVETY